VTLSTAPAITVPQLGRVFNSDRALAMYSYIDRATAARRGSQNCVTRLDRDVIANDISAIILLQTKLLDVDDGVHGLCEAVMLPTA